METEYSKQFDVLCTVRFIVSLSQNQQIIIIGSTAVFQP
jgi:hypothetical protein